jgi:hypothetical protein
MCCVDRLNPQPEAVTRLQLKASLRTRCCTEGGGIIGTGPATENLLLGRCGARRCRRIRGSRQGVRWSNVDDACRRRCCCIPDRTFLQVQGAQAWRKACGAWTATRRVSCQGNGCLKALCRSCRSRSSLSRSLQCPTKLGSPSHTICWRLEGPLPNKMWRTIVLWGIDPCGSRASGRGHHREGRKSSGTSNDDYRCRSQLSECRAHCAGAWTTMACDNS